MWGAGMISVIVPVYNAEKYLPQCIDSILAQTYTDFELIIVDDGSTDRSGQICDEYKDKDSRVYVVHQENRGVSAARNAGIDMAKGEYIAFVDSDDFIHNQMLELLFFALTKYSVDISVCTSNSIKDRKSCSEKHYAQFNSERLTAEELLVRHEWDYNYAWGKLYSKKLFSEIRYPEGKIFEDTLTTYKLLFKSKNTEIIWIDLPLYFYFYNEEGISHSFWMPRELEVFEGIRAQMDFYKLKGYEKAFEKEERLYVNHFAYQICRIRENKSDYKNNKKYIRWLRKKMMYLIFKNPTKYGYRKMPWCYEAAYPELMKIYHKCGKFVKSITGKNK